MIKVLSIVLGLLLSTSVYALQEHEELVLKDEVLNSTLNSVCSQVTGTTEYLNPKRVMVSYDCNLKVNLMNKRLQEAGKLINYKDVPVVDKASMLIVLTYNVGEYTLLKNAVDVPSITLIEYTNGKLDTYPEYFKQDFYRWYNQYYWIDVLKGEKK